MIECEICKKQFEYPSWLLRHYYNKKKCKDNETKLNVETSINCSDDNISILEKVQQKVENDIIKEQKTDCMYCGKILSTRCNILRHEKDCKFKNEPAIELEIELGISIGPYKHTTCKFCKKECNSRSSYNHHIKICKTKDEYVKELIKIRDSNCRNNIPK